MSDRVALVAGTGGVLGRAVALRLADACSTVVGVDRNADDLEELPEGIPGVPGDVVDPAVPRGLVWASVPSRRRSSSPRRLPRKQGH